MCSASPSFIIEPRRRPISSCSAWLYVKNVCNSKLLSSRGTSRAPKYVRLPCGGPNTIRQAKANSKSQKIKNLG